MSLSRRFVAGLFRIGLVLLALVFLSRYFGHRSSDVRHLRVQTEAPPPDSLGPGDLQIFNTDSSVDIILRGDKILAGLSPKTVAKVKSEMASSHDSAETGIGASISQIVKTSVASAIGTHAVFPLSDVRDVRYEHGSLIFDWKDGGTHQIFGNTKVNNEKVSNTFRAEDAERFVAAVRARKAGTAP